MESQVNIYEPNQRSKCNLFSTMVIMARNTIQARELIWQLFRRDFLMDYKKSFLGITWIFISPIIGIISWVFMNATGLLNPGDVGIPYPAYVLFSSSIWGLFIGFYSSATETLTTGQALISQVRYPHEAMLVKQTLQLLANFLLGFLLNIVILFAFGVVPSWKIVFFPLTIFPLFFLGAGIGLIFSVISVVTIDLKKGFDILMNLLMYITPVVYSNDVNNNILKKIMAYNPLTYLFGNVRDLILYGRFERPDLYCCAAGFALIFFIFACRLFYISEEKVIEKMI